MHGGVGRGLVRVSRVQVGVVMGVVSLRVMVAPSLPVRLAVVVVVGVVLVRVGRGLHVLVRVRVHVMVGGALLLP